MHQHHLIFDLDGTLVDSAPAILAGFATILEQANLTPVLSLDDHLIGPPLLATLARITGSADQGLLQSLAEAFKTYYDDKGIGLTDPYPGIHTTLLQLSQANLQLHLATNKRWRPTQRIMERLGWFSLFSSAYAQDKRQPAYASKTEMLAHLLEQESIDPDAAVYVGDTPEDGLAAAANGLAYIAVDWGYGNFDNWVGASRWMRISSCSDLLQASFLLLNDGQNYHKDLTR
jgi:phosphoglycolate phosphatase